MGRHYVGQEHISSWTVLQLFIYFQVVLGPLWKTLIWYPSTMDHIEQSILSIKALITGMCHVGPKLNQRVELFTRQFIVLYTTTTHQLCTQLVIIIASVNVAFGVLTTMVILTS